MSDGLGGHFQAETKHVRGRLGGHYLEWDRKPAAYKLYPDAPLIGLPEPDPPRTNAADADLFACIKARRSVRDFRGNPMTLLELSLLLSTSTGITASDGYQFYRASPSAGALYPIETYVVAHRVDGLHLGVYHYRHVSVDGRGRLSTSGGHALEQLESGDMRSRVAQAALDQPIAADAAAVFVWTAVFARSIWKYRERAYRYVYLDAGHIAAHLSLAAVAIGLGSCPIAAFYDDELNGLLGIDGVEESALYLTAVGRS